MTPVSPANTNRLIREKSPYLLQHAHNPVDWHPWGAEALERAKSENKPIFLSVGYSTCHWCHVMERESFENPEIAAIMNDHFINIKVDREERPDVDALYMSAVQMLTGTGGWPMSVWLTPDLKPFYAGTYFPPEERYGRPGFADVLTQLAEIWKRDREKVVSSSTEIASALAETGQTRKEWRSSIPDATGVMAEATRQLRAMHDAANGGFGGAPKFPMPVYLDYLIFHHAVTGEAESLSIASSTFRKMAAGGIFDQLGGGFARYSTDARWIVPHFEKMLYDNAQLINTGASLVWATGDAEIAEATRRAAEYVLRDLRHPQGGFFSAEDADSEGREGAFYLWTAAELRAVLEAESELAAVRYGVTADGNFTDPHTQESGKNVLVRAKSIEEVAKQFGLSRDDAKTALARVDKKLLEARARRPRPLLDDKILTEWNGLAIGALARAGLALHEPRYLRAAEDAADFIDKRLYDNAMKRLYRRWRDGERKIDGHQSDYAMLVQGLLDLFEATGRLRWLTWATELQQTHNRLFWDKEEGGFFSTETGSDLLFRRKELGDNVIPSGISVAVLNGYRMAAMTNREEYRTVSESCLESLAGLVVSSPLSFLKLLSSIYFHSHAPRQVVVVAAKDDPAGAVMVEAAIRQGLPNQAVIRLELGPDTPALLEFLPYLADKKMVDGRPTAYVCVDFACRRPTNDLAEYSEILSATV